MVRRQIRSSETFFVLLTFYMKMRPHCQILKFLKKCLLGAFQKFNVTQRGIPRPKSRVLEHKNLKITAERFLYPII